LDRARGNRSESGEDAMGVLTKRHQPPREVLVNKTPAMRSDDAPTPESARTYTPKSFGAFFESVNVIEITTALRGRATRQKPC